MPRSVATAPSLSDSLSLGNAPSVAEMDLREPLGLAAFAGSGDDDEGGANYREADGES
jgi:hypothetical protein